MRKLHGWNTACPVWYRVFSLTWPASMQIYWLKRKRLHKKGTQLPQDWFGTPTWPPFHCFGTSIWPPWRHVKLLYMTYSSLLWILTSLFNRPLPSSINPHFQNEANCATFLVKMSLIYMRMKNHFHIKGWALNLVFIKRFRGTRKWPTSPDKRNLCKLPFRFPWVRTFWSFAGYFDWRGIHEGIYLRRGHFCQKISTRQFVVCFTILWQSITPDLSPVI